MLRNVVYDVTRRKYSKIRTKEQSPLLDEIEIGGVDETDQIIGDVKKVSDSAIRHMESGFIRKLSSDIEAADSDAF